MILKNVIIRIGRSRTKAEIMPSAKEDMSDFKDFRQFIAYCLDVSEQAIQPGMTESEATIVKQEIKDMFGATDGWYRSDIESAEWRTFRSGNTFGNLEIDTEGL